MSEKILSNNKNKSILYVNFSPYENAGHILDYLLEEFQYTFLIVFNFYNLGKEQNKSYFKIYHGSKLTYSHYLYQIKAPQSLIFIFLPLRSLINFIELLFIGYRLKKRYGKIDYYFTVNAFTAWVGNVLKKLRIVSKTVFWVWDYYPPIHPNKIVMLMRWIYWQFDKLSTSSDKVVFLNNRLQNLRKDIGILSKNTKFPIVSIGTDPHYSSVKTKELKLVQLGVVKKSQGLDFIIKNWPELSKKFEGISLDIIGGGPDIGYFKRLAKKHPRITFHGFVADEKKMQKILSTSSIGLATYIPEESNVSYYGDPSKIKTYLSYGLPVITTNVFEFSEIIKKNNAGITITYGNSTELIEAVQGISKKMNYYKKSSRSLGEKYYYKRIYSSLFKD